MVVGITLGRWVGASVGDIDGDRPTSNRKHTIQNNLSKDILVIMTGWLIKVLKKKLDVNLVS